MYIVITVWYPLIKVDEVAKKFLELTKDSKPNPNIKRMTMTIKMDKGGIVTTQSAEVEKGKLEEELIRTSNFMTGYKTIEGLSYRIETQLSLEEAAATIGMSLPG